MPETYNNPLDRLEKPAHADERPIYEDSAASKTQRKIWENPMVPLGENFLLLLIFIFLSASLLLSL